MNKLSLVFSLLAVLSLFLTGCAVSEETLQDANSNVKGITDTVNVPVVLTMDDGTETMDATAKGNIGSYKIKTYAGVFEVNTTVCFVTTVNKDYAEAAEEGNLDLSLSYGLYDYETGEIIMMADTSQEADDQQSSNYSLLEENDVTCFITRFEKKNYGGIHSFITKSYDIARKADILVRMPAEAAGHQFALVFFSTAEDGSQVMNGGIAFGEEEGTFEKLLHLFPRIIHDNECCIGAV